MAGAISPGRLLSTLKILLSPNGGIKSFHEVGRLVSLMEKFSRKLVSKVIYIHILRSSAAELVDAFLAESGWCLLSSWLSTAVSTYNWPLCSELLQLLTLCPSPPVHTSSAVLHLLLDIQRHHQLHHLAALAQQINSTWSQKSSLQAVYSNLSSSSVISSVGTSSPLDSPMSLSRRCKRSVIVTNPLVVSHSSTPANVAMSVTFQEKPLQNIVDVFRHQRRRSNEEIETQEWKKQPRGERKSICKNPDESKNKSLLRSDVMLLKSENPTACVSVNSSMEEDNDEFVVTKRPRRSLNAAAGTSVTVVNDELVIQIVNLNDKSEDVEVEETNPLKIFEDISKELNENLLNERHIAVNQESRRGGSLGRSKQEGNVWGLNKFDVNGLEGSAKDFRLARREKFREEQKLLEEQNEVRERKEREVKRERVKKAKREEDRRTKDLKEMEEKRRKIEYEAEEKKKREKTEAEFKQRREKERLRRKEKERQERNLGSFKKSELKNGLNSEEKSRIKLIAQQMKQSSDVSDSTPSTAFQGRIPKLNKIAANDEIESAYVNKPAKPMFSVAKNKNKDLLASLEAPLKPMKRPVVVTRNPLIKKSVPPVLSRNFQGPDPGDEYGISPRPLDSAIQIPKRKDVNQDVSPKLILKDSSHEVEVIASKSIAEQDNPELEDVKQVESLPEVVKQESKPEEENKEHVEISSPTIGMQSDGEKLCVNKDSKTKTGENTSHQQKDYSSSSSKSKSSKSVMDLKKSCKMKSTQKPPLTLKPVSQLKESSVFGSFLENVEKNVKKKRKSNSTEDHNKNSKHFKIENSKPKVNPVSKPHPASVANVPRKVSGILIVERGSGVTKKAIKWREDENLVQVEYFEVHDSERVNVHKLKFEEVRQQERVKERSLLSSRHHPMEKEGDEKPWRELKTLDNCGRSNFKAGDKSHEKGLQQLREARVLPIVWFGDVPLNPSEPEVSISRNIFDVMTVRDILAEDISGEGTEVDYSAEEWPEPAGYSEQGIVAGQFHPAREALVVQDKLVKGHEDYHGKKTGGEVGQRFPSYPHGRGFGRGGAASQAMRGFRGGFDMRGRGGFGGRRNVPCKYWRRGSCRDGQNCIFLHV